MNFLLFLKWLLKSQMIREKILNMINEIEFSLAITTERENVIRLMAKKEALNEILDWLGDPIEIDVSGA